MRKGVSIIGKGVIATELKKRLEEQGHEVVIQITREAGESSDWFNRNYVDAVFIAISTQDNGEAASEYIRNCLAHHTPVITCEKGALSNNARNLLRKNFGGGRRFGYSAAVGGGTRLIKVLQGRPFFSLKHAEIRAVLNGTLNFVFSEVSLGKPLAAACATARKLNFAEPGATDPLDVVNGELVDVVMKACVVYNTTLATKDIISPKDLGGIELTRESLRRYSRSEDAYRFIVTFEKGYKEIPVDLGGEDFFYCNTVEGWRIYGHFEKTNGKTGYAWLPSAEGNAIKVTEGEFGEYGEYRHAGPGAGPGPTVSAMLSDLHEFRL